MKTHLVFYAVGTSNQGALVHELLPLVDALSLALKQPIDLCLSSEGACLAARAQGYEANTIDQTLLSLAGVEAKDIFIVNLVLVGGHHDRLLKEGVKDYLTLNPRSRVTVTAPILTIDALILPLISAMTSHMTVLDHLGLNEKPRVLMVVHGQKPTSKFKDRGTGPYILYRTFFDHYQAHVGDQYRVSITDLNHFEQALLDLDTNVIYIEPLFLLGGDHIEEDVFKGEGSLENRLLKQDIQVGGRKKGLLSLDTFKVALVNYYQKEFDNL